MSNDAESSQSRKSQSAFKVAASPFNAIKLELVLILIVGFLLWLVLHSITDNDLTHLAVLFIYSVSGSFWLLIRIRNVARQSSTTESMND